MSKPAGSVALRAASTFSRTFRSGRLTPKAPSIAQKLPILSQVRQFHGKAALFQSEARSDSTNHLPEFSLRDKVIIVTGAARGLGLVQSEALLEAGAKVYALDRLEEPDSDFARVQQRAKALGTDLAYVRIDVRDNVALNATTKKIADDNGRIDGLLACAGIQLEKPALDHTMEESDRIMGVNVTGVFMTAQAVARQMKRLERPGSMALIASMSGTVANKGLLCPYVWCSPFFGFPFLPPA